MYKFEYSVDELNAVVKYIKENNFYVLNLDENYILNSIRGSIKNWHLTKPSIMGTLGYQIIFEKDDEDDQVYLSFKVDVFYKSTTKDYATYVPGQSTTTYRL